MTQYKKSVKRRVGIIIVGIVSFSGLHWICSYIAKTLSYSINQKNIAAISLIVTLIFMLPMLVKKKRSYEGIEYGSARWGNKKDIRYYIDKDYQSNTIFSDSLRMSKNMRKTHRNNHVLVSGGSGSGKSRNLVKPNVLQMNASYVITDPKGEHLKSEGKMLEDNGYKIKKFSIVDFQSSMKFNPFVYFTETKDIRRFVNMLMQNTSGDTSNPNYNEDFWAKAERLWFMAAAAYLQEECQKDEQNINSIITLLECSEARDDDEDFVSTVDVLFRDLLDKNPRSFAAKQYLKYKLAAGKTAKSILISMGVRLADFDIPEISDIVSDDELELDKIGDEKTALFIEIDDLDTTYNYIVAILLDVMFNCLKRKADSKPAEHLDIPVDCYLDEIANIGKFPTLHILVAVLRSRWINLILIFQNFSQLKAIYKDNAATIEGNCDTTIFLGGKGEDTQKHVSEVMVGKTTIDTISSGGSGGQGSIGLNSYNNQEQQTGRSLIDESEVAKLADDECIVTIRGLEPFKDKKFKTEKHKNYKLLADNNKNNIYVFKSKKPLHTQLHYRYVTEIDLTEEIV